nr:hypothetical protein [Tanacetum cinerariifolium]
VLRILPGGFRTRAHGDVEVRCGSGFGTVRCPRVTWGRKRNSGTKMPLVVPISTRQPKRIDNQSVAKPLRRIVTSESTNQKPRYTTKKLYEHVSKACSWWYPKFTLPGYTWKPKSQIGNVNLNLIEIFLFIIDSGCSKHMTGNLKLLINFVEKFLDLEVAFRKSTCYIRDLKGNDLLTATSSQAWLWHRRLSYLNFDTINLLSKNDIVIGLPKLKFVKYHLCSSFVDDYSRYTWTYFLRSKYETLEVLIDFLRLVQRGLHAQMASDHVSSDPVPQCQRAALEHDNLSPDPQCQENVPHAVRIVTTSNELYLLFGSIFDELLNGSSQVVSKSSAITTTDAPNKCQQQHTTPLNTQITPEPTCHVSTQAPTVTSTENINQAEMITENAQVEDDRFINIFCTPVQDRGETLSRHVDSSNMHTFYQRHPSEHRWTKDHPLKQVIGNPSQSVRTRRQLESDGEICMFALIVS